MVRHSLSLALLLALGACANVPMATPQEEALGKRFDSPPPDKGAVYVYRQGLMGAMATVDVAIATGSGGLNVALAPDTWVRLEGDPGPLEVRCANDQSAAARLDVAPGETRYVEASYRIGLMKAGCDVAEVSPAQGQNAVSRGRRTVAQ